MNYLEAEDNEARLDYSRVSVFCDEQEMRNLYDRENVQRKVKKTRKVRRKQKSRM